MPLDVPAPVGDARDLAAQAFHGGGELHSVGLDRAADLSRGALGHQLSPPAPVAGWAVPAPCCSGAELTASRILRASSIAMFGTGGEPRLTAFAAIRPASAPSSTRITAI